MKIGKFIGGLLVGGLAAYGAQDQGIRNYVSHATQNAYQLVMSEEPAYKGTWRLHEIKPEDGTSPIWKASRSCTQSLGENSNYWREQISDFNKKMGRDLRKPQKVGDKFWVPEECYRTQIAYKK